jgi:phenylalanyl-tRNA synthetase beta chain
MKFTLSWLKDHLETHASVAEVVDAMTMAGLEVEHVEDPASRLAAFSVARIVEAKQHPNADRLRVCQVDTKDGRKEIVCGAPNARAGLTTVYAPLGAYIPGSGVTLEAKPVRGVVSNGMMCSARELELGQEHDGIIELPDSLPVGAPASEALGQEAVIDFEVTPNRPDWLGVAGIARDLAAAGVGRLKDHSVNAIAGGFPCPIDIRISSADACPMFAGRLIRDLKNGPSPAWMQEKLKSVGLRPINALVDVTNFLTYDRGRPLHVYDAAKIQGGFLEARLATQGESLLALDGRTYELDGDVCVIADASGVIDLGGVMGGDSTGCSEETTEVFIEAAYFDPIRTAETGRRLGLISDAQYRFARGVDPGFVVPGLELATRLILEFCGGEASDVRIAGEAPSPVPPVEFDPAYVHRLSGLSVAREGVVEILSRLGFEVEPHGTHLKVQPPSWRRDVEGKADLVEEVARIAGFGALPSTALPEIAARPAGVLTPRQTRVQTARRALATLGYAEAATWSFTSQKAAALFGGGQDELVLANPIAAELDCMRPSLLPNLVEAAGRNAARGFPDAALFEIGPVFAGDRPQDQRTAIGAVLAPHPPRHWRSDESDPLFGMKGDLLALLEALGAPTSSLQISQADAAPWWHPGRSARMQLGPKTVVAAFGQIHPSVLKALDVEGPLYGFEVWVEAIPEPKKKAAKTRPQLQASSLMPLSRDFAFVLDASRPAGDVVRAAVGVDRTLITGARVFDVYQGAGVPEGSKSVAIEVSLQPWEKTLTDAEIEQLSSRIVQAVEKACGAKLRA